MSTAHDRTVLSVPDFRSFLAARFFSSVALQMISVAVGWQVYDLTADPLHLGYVGLVQFVPAFLFALPAGQISDRFQRRMVLFLCLAVLTLATFGLLALALHPEPSLALLYCVLAVMGAMRAFYMPSSQALTPLLVPQNLLAPAVAWSSSARQIAVIAGPALGGLCYAFHITVVYAVAAILLAASAVATYVLKPRPQDMAVMKPGLDGLFEGVRFVVARKDILGAVSLDLFAVLLGGATALLPIYARDILHVGPVGLGVLRSAPAVGAAITALTLARRPMTGGAGHKLFAAVAVFGIATIVFGLSTSFWLSLAALTVLGAADMISVVVRQTLVQIRTPDTMRGRVSAVNSVFIGASNELGEFESGLTAAWFGIVPAVVIGGLGTLGIAALWAWKFPDLRKVDRLE